MSTQTTAQRRPRSFPVRRGLVLAASVLVTVGTALSVVSLVPVDGLLVADPTAAPLGVVLVVMYAVAAGFAVWLLPAGGR
jgi:hypothetical protein